MWQRVFSDLQQDPSPIVPLYTYLWVEHRLGTFVVVAVLFQWIWLLRHTEVSKGRKRPAWQARATFGVLVVSVLIFFVWLQNDAVQVYLRQAVR